MYSMNDAPLGDEGLGLTDVAAGLISGAITVAGGLATMGIGAAATKKQQERASAQERRLLEMRQQHEKEMTEMMLKAQTQQMQVPQTPSYSHVPQPGMLPGGADLMTQLGAAQDAAKLAQQQALLDAQAAALQQQQMQMMMGVAPTLPPTEAEKQKKRERLKKILLYTGLGLGGAAVVGTVIYFVVGR